MDTKELKDRLVLLKTSLLEREEYLQKLSVSIEQTKNDIQAINGAMQECQHWTTVLGNKEKESEDKNGKK